MNLCNILLDLAFGVPSFLMDRSISTLRNIGARVIGIPSYRGIHDGTASFFL
jgi:hypothetical protein